MGSVGSYIFGSGPSTSTVSPAPTNQLDPTQQALEQILSSELTSNTFAPGGAFTGTSMPYTSPLVPSSLLTAPTSDLQNLALNDISGGEVSSLALAQQLATGQNPTQNMSLGALENATTTAENPNTAAGYFQNAVYAPLEQTFTQQTLPNIVSALGGNQGGPQSTAAASAVSQATNNFENTLASTQANVGLQEQAQLPTLANDLTSAALVPLGATTQGLTNSAGALSAGGVPQGIAQAGLTNEQSYYQNQFTNSQSFLNDLLGILADQTTTPQDVVVNPGSTGLLSSVIQAYAKGAGGMSDRRVKKDIKRVGTTENNLPLYLFHYKWEDDSDPIRLGLMAQDVEKVNPDAVGEYAGTKFVDYLAALQMEDA